MATICPKTLTGIEVSCEGSAGGIKRVLVVPREAINIPEPGETTGLIKATEITKKGSDAVAFVEYKFRPQTASMTSSATIDAAIGSSSISTELALQFTKMEQTKRVAIQQAINVGSCAIVEDYNGEKYFLGYDMPMFATSVNAQTGTEIGELNGYNLTLTDVSFALPFHVDATEAELNALLAEVPAE